MAMQKQDELNNLAIPYDEYFGEMGISEEEKQKRIELAELIDDIFFFAFSMMAAEKKANMPFNKEYYIDFIDRRFKDMLDDQGIDYIDKYPWLNSHIRDIATEVVEQNEKKPDDEWQLSNDRAMLIAENEANSIGEYVVFQNAVDGGKTRKTWNTMIDYKVRHTHMELESLTIPIMETFKVGNYEMYQPKDTSLGAGMEEIANCRCWCTYS